MVEVLWEAEKLMVKALVEALVIVPVVEFKVVMVPVVDQKFVAVKLVVEALTKLKMPPVKFVVPETVRLLIQAVSLTVR